MMLEKCLSALQIENAIDTFRPEWESSQKSFSFKPSYLAEDFLRGAVQKYLGDAVDADALLASADRLLQNEAALRLLCHQHYLVVKNYEKHWLKCYRFPELPVLKEDARAYYLLLALSGAYFFGDVHAKLGIPQEDLQATLKEIRQSVQASIEKKNLVGVAPHFSGWWQGFFSGRLYRLGRLSFLREKYVWPFHVFENRETKDLKVFSGEGLAYNSQNLRALKNDQTAWVSHYRQAVEALIGNPIDPSGFASPESVRLDLQDWTPVVANGDATLSVHIAAGEPMDLKACIESFKRARAFFGRYFEAEKIKLFTCDTWLLNPQLKPVLPETSNIVQFQKRFLLVPSDVDAEFVPIRTIFGHVALEKGIDQVEASTSLQKGAKELKKRGLVLRHGYGLHPFDRDWEKETHS